MATSKGKRKRSKAITIMLLPALIPIFIVGWLLYCMGDQKRSYKIQHKLPKKDNVSIIPIVFEEPQKLKSALPHRPIIRSKTINKKRALAPFKWAITR